MVIKVQGGRIRVDDNEPRVIKIGGVGPQGPVGVVNATAPVTYNSTTKTVGITTGTANGVAPLDANSLVPKANLPSVAINDTFVVASQAAMLALTAQTGDVAIRTDVNKNFILATDSPSTLADWKELLTPPDAVTSVAGKTGVVTLTNTDITGLGSLATKSTITSSDITDGTIATADIADSAITTAKLATGAVVTADLADSAVTSAKIADGTIVNADVNASAAIADSKLNLTTTVSGTAVSSTNKLHTQQSDPWYLRRTSDASTGPIIIASTTSSVTLNQECAAGKAFVLTTRSYDKIRCRFGTTGSGLTDVRLVVWNTSGTVLAYSSNLVTAGAVSTTFANTDNLALNTSISLTAGDIIWLGVIAYGASTPTIPSLNGFNYITSSASLGLTIATTGSVTSEQMAYSRQNTTWTGGTSIPTLTNGGGKFFAPWVELIGA